MNSPGRVLAIGHTVVPRAWRACALVFLALATMLRNADGGAAEAGAAVGTTPLTVKVMIINLFQLEAAPWLEALRPTQ
jgi:purine nucleoside permease